MPNAASADGTKINYRTIGKGPGVILLHGSFETIDSHKELAEFLSSDFAVTTYNRRGRLDNPSYGPNYVMATEVQDLAAVLASTSSHYIWGVSTGGLICLQAAHDLPDVVRKVAVFEPVLSVNGSVDMSCVPRYEREMKEGRVGAALVTAMLGSQMGPSIFPYFPRWLLEWMTRSWLDKSENEVKPGDVSLREIAPTLGKDFQLVAEMADTHERFKTVQAQALLMVGTKSQKYFQVAIPALEKTMPHTRTVVFPGFNHLAACNVDKQGHPDVIAKELKAFFNDK